MAVSGTPQPKTYNGKRFVFAFAAVLLIVLVAGLWVTEYGASCMTPGLEKKAKERREKEQRERELERQREQLQTRNAGPTVP